MPYVDQSQPGPAKTLPPILPYFAIAGAMLLSVGLYWVFYENLGLNQWLAPLLVGVLIGSAMRFTSKQTLPHAGKIAIIATLITCLVGYVVRHVLWIKWLDPTFQPTVGHAFSTLLSTDLMAILLMAMSAYFAFTIGVALPRSASLAANQSS